MSQKQSKKFNGLTYLGWFACLVIIVAAAFYLFIAQLIYGVISFDIYFLIYRILSYVRGGAEVLLLLSFFNYCISLPSSKKTILMVLLGGTALFRILEMTVGIYWEGANFLKPPVKSVALLIAFILYWEKGLIPKILAGIIGLRMLLLLISGLTDSVTISRLGLFLLVGKMLGIMIWFGMGIPEKTEAEQLEGVRMQSYSTPQQRGSAGDQTYKAPAVSPATTIISPQTHVQGNGQGLPPKTEWTHGIPRLLYWCNQCQQQKKFKPKTDADIEKENPCPTCGTPLLGWWVEPKKDTYIRFMGGLMIAFSGFTTILFTTNFGNVGLYPLILLMVLSIAELGIGFYLAWKATSVKITAPAPWASTTPSKDGNKDFIKELIIFVVIAFGGAMVGYFINSAIVSIFF